MTEPYEETPEAAASRPPGAAPRGRRWTLRLLWLALGFAAAALLFADPFGWHRLDERLRPAAPAAAGHLHSEEEAATLWTCGMHPQVLEEEPGQCPICGMDLVPVSSVGSGVTAAAGSAPTVTIDPRAVQNMNVVSEPVVRRDMTRSIRTVGYLEYDQQKMVSVTTKYPGWVERVYVNYVGEPVRRGAPLFEIYSPLVVQTARELVSALEFAERMAGGPSEAGERASALVTAARTRLGYWDVPEAQIERLVASREVFRTVTVRAPADGVVMQRLEGLEGRAVEPGTELFHIADLSSLWLSVEVFEDQLAWVREDSTAEVALSYFPGEAFNGRVRFIEPAVAEATRTVSLRLEVPNRDGRLRAGMYATVTFTPTTARDVLAVPSQAVLRTGERLVAVVDLGAGRFAPRDVELGVEGEGWAQVLSGLAEGERVVTSAQFLIDSESKLRQAVERLAAERRGADAGGGG